MQNIPESDLESEETLLTNAYKAFNQRNIDIALDMMHPEVDWPNGMEGGIEHGHEAVRSYWTRQWTMIDPNVEPIGFEKLEDGRIDVTVHQVVKDLSGNLMVDGIVHHIYTIENGLINTMEIKK